MKMKEYGTPTSGPQGKFIRIGHFKNSFFQNNEKIFKMCHFLACQFLTGFFEKTFFCKKCHFRISRSFNFEKNDR